jgi:hypothetical protein
MQARHVQRSSEAAGTGGACGSDAALAACLRMCGLSAADVRRLQAHTPLHAQLAGASDAPRGVATPLQGRVVTATPPCAAATPQHLLHALSAGASPPPQSSRCAPTPLCTCSPPGTLHMRRCVRMCRRHKRVASTGAPQAQEPAGGGAGARGMDAEVTEVTCCEPTWQGQSADACKVVVRTPSVLQQRTDAASGRQLQYRSECFWRAPLWSERSSEGSQGAYCEGDDCEGAQDDAKACSGSALPDHAPSSPVPQPATPPGACTAPALRSGSLLRPPCEAAAATAVACRSTQCSVARRPGGANGTVLVSCARGSAGETRGDAEADWSDLDAGECLPEAALEAVECGLRAARLFFGCTRDLRTVPQQSCGHTEPSCGAANPLAHVCTGDTAATLSDLGLPGMQHGTPGTCAQHQPTLGCHADSSGHYCGTRARAQAQCTGPIVADACSIQQADKGVQMGTPGAHSASALDAGPPASACKADGIGPPASACNADAAVLAPGSSEQACGAAERACAATLGGLPRGFVDELLDALLDELSQHTDCARQHPTSKLPHQLPDSDHSYCKLPLQRTRVQPALQSEFSEPAAAAAAHGVAAGTSAARRGPARNLPPPAGAAAGGHAHPAPRAAFRHARTGVNSAHAAACCLQPACSLGCHGGGGSRPRTEAPALGAPQAAACVPTFCGGGAATYSDRDGAARPTMAHWLPPHCDTPATAPALPAATLMPTADGPWPASELHARPCSAAGEHRVAAFAADHAPARVPAPALCERVPAGQAGFAAHAAPGGGGACRAGASARCVAGVRACTAGGCSVIPQQRRSSGASMHRQVQALCNSLASLDAKMSSLEAAQRASEHVLADHTGRMGAVACVHAHTRH